MRHKYVAVIQAGGLGTRMQELTKNIIPKPMLLLNGRPMLEWQIQNIVEYGIRDFVIIIGHLGEKIVEYFHDGNELGVHIQYIEEKEPLGSAGALALLKSMYHFEATDFLVVFGDVMFDLDIHRLCCFHEKHSGQATLLAHPNAHPYDSDLLLTDNDDQVLRIISKHEKRNEWYENLVNAGIYVLSGELMADLSKEGIERMDMERDVLKPLMGQGKVYAYRTPEYIKDAGTPERFLSACREQREGVWEQKNLTKKQRCVFLDRDGTINKYQGLIYKEEQLELEPGAAEAIRLLNEDGYLAIVVTNQPVVARGLCNIGEVEQIHKKLQVLLGEQGAYLDDIVYCPHHPDKGYPEENPLYKIPCKCRKPDTGMIDKMLEKYNIDSGKSYMIGDSSVDIQTGRNAGLKTILVATGQAGKDGKYCVQADMQVKDLLDAVKVILNKK